MNPSISLQTRFADRFIAPIDYQENLKKAQDAFQILISRKGKGNEFLGWLDLPDSSFGLLERIHNTAKRIQNNSDYLVVIGIGGSYLGTRAILEAVQPFFPTTQQNSSPKILYAGHHLDPSYHHELIKFLEDKNFSINVVSKSGTTTEPAIAFRFLWDLLVKKYGNKEAKDRVIATTDAKKGALKTFADAQGFETYVIPDDVGGRYSVLTPVGLLPIAIGGGNITQLLKGAQSIKDCILKDSLKNISIQYALYRNALYQTGRKIEILVSYNPKFQYFSEWWKQLFGESEGKENKGIFPASVQFTTDLHSLGQYIQEGERIIIETVLQIQKPNFDCELPSSEEDLDGLNFLAGKNLSWINEQANLGTLVAHTEGGIPCIEINVPEFNEYHLGELIYFFEVACGISGYMLGVNPFDQPGVENYKNNMFALLGKKGFEEKKLELLKGLGISIP